MRAPDQKGLSETRAVAPGSTQSEGLRPFGTRPLRTFALTIGLPAFLLYVVSAALVVGALLMMAREIDRLDEQRALTVTAAALETFLNGVSDAVADEGTWNEAHLNVVIAPNPAWMDQTWGTTARLGATYNDVIVTDNQGGILFGENNLGPIRGRIGDQYSSAPEMLVALDSAINSAGDGAVVAEFSSMGAGQVGGLAAISIHKSTPGEINVPRHQRRILWIARYLTPPILQDIAARYQVPLPRVVEEPAPSMLAISLADGRNSVVGTVAWMPERTGDEAFRHAALLATGAFFGLGLLLSLGLRRLRRAMLRRAAALDEAVADIVHRAEETTAAGMASRERIAPDGGAEVAFVDDAASAIAGVAAGAFVVEYQPVFDLRAESLPAAEVLLRWERPDGSPLPQEDLGPDDCAVLMEKAGIVALRHAAADLAPMLGVTVSLNVAPEQVRSGVFAEKVGGTLKAVKFPPERLQLHVDAALLPAFDSFAPHLMELRRTGATVALSNFSLNERTMPYLRPGLVDRILLAPAMARGADTDPVRWRLIAATVESAREAGIEITVAGIERKEDAARLLRLGCREFRGPLLAGPMPLASLTALILAPARPARAG